MRHWLKTTIAVTLLSILFTGLIGFEVLLPHQIPTVADAENLPEESLEELEEENNTTEEPPIIIDENTKVAYLTFDDGPSPNVTPLILDILQDYDIKATFFVIGNLSENYPEILLRIKEEGHFIGNHTYTHNYKYIYKNPSNFIEELERTEQSLSSILGDSISKIVRFPGGSFGKKLQPFRQAVEEAGYLIVDWNVVSGDAEGNNVSPQKQLSRLQETVENKKEAIVLMHDSATKQSTIEALPAIIDYLISQGYVFSTLQHYGN